MSKLVRLSDVSKRFGQKEVLKQINLSVTSGEILGILGPSGAGKTTLLHLITQRLSPDTGKIVYGKACKDALFPIGAMMDTLGLYDRLSIQENLSFYARLFHQNPDQLPALLQRIGLDQDRHTRCAKLSKGMRDRLALARALLAHAPLLLLDEPTAGLDPLSTERIHTILLEEKAKGTTILLCTHHMEEADKLCDHIALLHQGEIIEYGTPTEICQRHTPKNAIRVCLQDGTVITYHRQKDGADAIRAYLLKECIASMHTSEHNLEQVFIELSGRGLHDEEYSVVMAKTK